MQRMAAMMAAVMAAVVLMFAGGCEQGWPPMMSQDMHHAAQQLEAGDPAPAPLAQVVQGVEAGDPMPESLVSKVQSVEPGEPIPKGISSHPADMTYRRGTATAERLEPIADPATGGWFGIVAGAIGALYGVGRKVMADVEKRERRRAEKEADREREDRQRAEGKAEYERDRREQSEKATEAAA
jgi:Sec-independent protein translocase protein TatA